MDSRERVFGALNREAVDRAPVDFWASDGFYGQVQRELGLDKDAFLDQHPVDFRYIEGPRYIGPPLAADADIWGVTRRKVAVPTTYGQENYSEVSRHPLLDATSVEQVESYDGWPSPDWFDYSVVRAQCAAIRDRGLVVMFMGDRMNRIAQLKPAMYIRGIEQIFMDLAMSPDLTRAILGRIRAFYREYLARILEAADGLIDIVLTGDDFGSQNGPLLAPSMWEDFLAEGFGEYIAIAHSHDAKVMHHTCGMVTPLVPAFVSRGLDILQSLQPEAMGSDFAALKETYGDRLAFQGGISIQQTMPYGTPETIRAEVRARMETLGSGGGYILCTAHNVQADCPLANVEALFKAYVEEGARS
jgi:uroporphyrinogen decarboxylase